MVTYHGFDYALGLVYLVFTVCRLCTKLFYTAYWAEVYRVAELVWYTHRAKGLIFFFHLHSPSRADPATSELSPK